MDFLVHRYAVNAMNLRSQPPMKRVPPPARPLAALLGSPTRGELFPTNHASGYSGRENYAESKAGLQRKPSRPALGGVEGFLPQFACVTWEL